MSWEQVECVKCGQPMGERDGLFVGTEPWHKDCHYNVLTTRVAAAEAFVAKHRCQTCGGVRVREAELCKCDEAAKGGRDE